MSKGQTMSDIQHIWVTRMWNQEFKYVGRAGNGETWKPLRDLDFISKLLKDFQQSCNKIKCVIWGISIWFTCRDLREGNYAVKEPV